MPAKWLIPLLLFLLTLLQFRLWFGEGGLGDVVRLHNEIETQTHENDRLHQRNDVLSAEVKALKNGLDAVEEHAREDLGMVKPNETYFMVLDSEKEEEKR